MNAVERSSGSGKELIRKRLRRGNELFGFSRHGLRRPLARGLLGGGAASRKRAKLQTSTVR
jgi:hypothetical protein